MRKIAISLPLASLIGGAVAYDFLQFRRERRLSDLLATLINVDEDISQTMGIFLANIR